MILTFTHSLHHVSTVRKLKLEFPHCNFAQTKQQFHKQVITFLPRFEQKNNRVKVLLCNKYSCFIISSFMYLALFNYFVQYVAFHFDECVEGFVGSQV